MSYDLFLSHNHADKAWTGLDDGAMLALWPGPGDTAPHGILVGPVADGG